MRSNQDVEAAGVPTVEVPPPYRGPTGGVARIEVEGESVRECLDAVGKQFPGLPPLLFAETRELHRFVRLFVNGEPLERDALDTPVSDGDSIEILAAIAGGSGGRCHAPVGAGRVLW